MNDIATERLSEYISDIGVKISEISRKTKIPDGVLRRSLSNMERPLRADEFLGICDFLKVDPAIFWNRKT